MSRQITPGQSSSTQKRFTGDKEGKERKIKEKKVRRWEGSDFYLDCEVTCSQVKCGKWTLGRYVIVIAIGVTYV